MDKTTKLTTINNNGEDAVLKDFDLEAETKQVDGRNVRKQVPSSTIKKQLKKVDGLLKYSPSVVTFDKLKMAINLTIYGAEIGFKLLYMQETDYPTIVPNSYAELNEQVARFQKTQAAMKDSEDDEKYDISDLLDDTNDDSFDEFSFDFDSNDDEDELEIFGENTYHDCRIPYEAYKNNIGIINIYIKNDILVINLSGKFMASRGRLGRIHRNNIRECLQRVIQLGLFTFDIDAFIELADCLSADVTMDIEFESNAQVDKTIRALSSFMPLCSQSYQVRKYRNSIFVKKFAKDAGHSLVIYSKGAELRHSKIRETRASKYTKLIGRMGEEVANRTLRLELHLFKFKDIRRYLMIGTVERRRISLQDVLDSTEMPLFVVFDEMGIDIEKLKTHLLGYLPIAKKLEKKRTLTQKELTDILSAERYAQLIKENNFNIATTIDHIAVEYGVDKDCTLFKQLSKIVKDNLYDYLCFAKPKTITLIIALFERIMEDYARRAEVQNV